MSSPRNTALRVAAIATLGAGVIHLAVVEDHARTWWVSGVFFALLTALQIGWGLLALARPRLLDTTSRRGLGLLATGALVNGGSALLWAVTRWITGEPFGPNAGTELPVGPAGIASTVLELVALGAVVVGPRLHSRPVRGLAPALLVAGLVLVAPTAWGVAGSMSHDHASHSESGEGHHDDGGHDEGGHDEGGHDDGGHDEGGHDDGATKQSPKPGDSSSRTPGGSGKKSGDKSGDQTNGGGHEDDGHAH